MEETRLPPGTVRGPARQHRLSDEVDTPEERTPVMATTLAPESKTILRYEGHPYFRGWSPKDDPASLPLVPCGTEILSVWRLLRPTIAMFAAIPGAMRKTGGWQ